MESFEVKKYYEWLTTSRAGKVEEYVAEDDTTVYFQSGRFIPKDQLDVQLRLVDESTYLSKGGDEQNYTPPPPPSPQTIEEWEKMIGNPEQNSIAPPQPKVEVEKSPVRIILEKQKKKVTKTINVEFTFNIPNDKAIEFMSMMFDEEEIMDEIIDDALTQLSKEEIREIIKESIRNEIKGSLSSEEFE
jgi:hypothetical protein